MAEQRQGSGLDAPGSGLFTLFHLIAVMGVAAGAFLGALLGSGSGLLAAALGGLLGAVVGHCIGWLPLRLVSVAIRVSLRLKSTSDLRRDLEDPRFVGTFDLTSPSS